MTTSPPSSNVYILPQPLAVVAPARAARRRLPLRLRVIAWWWRLRLTAREVADALRRFGRPKPRAGVDELALAVEAEVLVSRPRAAGPALIIDFAAAVERRRSRR